jgi:hypothetical protein
MHDFLPILARIQHLAVALGYRNIALCIIGSLLAVLGTEG